MNTESLTGGGTAAAGGAAGTAANIPGVAATGTGSASKYNHKQTSTTFGVNKDVTHEIVAPGAINRQSVSVLVDSSVPASAIPALRAAVIERGRSAGKARRLAVVRPGRVPEGPDDDDRAAEPDHGLRQVRRGRRSPRSSSCSSSPGCCAGVRTSRSPATRHGSASSSRRGHSPHWRPPSAQPTRVAQLNTPVNVAKRQIEDLVERDPDRVAQQVRAWMSED